MKVLLHDESTNARYFSLRLLEAFVADSRLKIFILEEKPQETISIGNIIEYRSDDVTKIYFWNFKILTIWSERPPYSRHVSKVSDK